MPDGWFRPVTPSRDERPGPDTGVARYLAGERGVRQFLDMGTGLPTAGSVHEIGQKVP